MRILFGGITMDFHMHTHISMMTGWTPQWRRQCSIANTTFKKSRVSRSLFVQHGELTVIFLPFLFRGLFLRFCNLALWRMSLSENTRLYTVVHVFCCISMNRLNDRWKKTQTRARQGSSRRRRRSKKLFMMTRQRKHRAQERYSFNWMSGRHTAARPVNGSACDIRRINYMIKIPDCF